MHACRAPVLDELDDPQVGVGCLEQLVEPARVGGCNPVLVSDAADSTRKALRTFTVT